jgi:hypothetical protein
MGVETLYSARWDGVTLIERGANQTVAVAIERDGSAASLTSATFSLYGPSGEAVLSVVVATVAAGTVSYTIPSATLADEGFGRRWLVRFDVTDAAGDVATYYNDAVICLARLYPTVGHTDLITRHHDLGNLLPAGVTSTQGYIDAAWATLTGKLYSEGVPFWRLRTPTALRDPLLALALEYVFRDLSTLLDAGDRYDELSRRYEASFGREFSKIRSLIDTNEENSVDPDQKGTTAVLMLSSGPRRRRF